MPKRIRRSRRAGFTLVEMMVSLAIGALVIVAVFTLGGASARHFQEQQRVGVTQRSVRMAMNRLRRDVARAGFLGIPSDRSPWVGLCTGPRIPRRVQGVWMTDDDPVGNGALDRVNRAANGVSADRLRLVGNYTTSDEYQVRTGPLAVGNRIPLATNTRAFVRSFMVNNGVGLVQDVERFNDTFRAGRFLRIEAMSGEVAVVQILGANWAGDAANITIAPGIGDSMQCPSGPVDVSGSTVAVLSEIEYFIDRPRGAGADLLDPRAAAVVGPQTLLIRHELDMRDGSVMANTRRIALEFAVDFNVDLVVDTNLAAGTPPNLVLREGRAAQDVSVNQPWLIRAARLSLAARAPEQDRRFPWTYGAGRPAGTPLNRFRVMTGQPGAARVRQLNAEVQLYNMIPRGV